MSKTRASSQHIEESCFPPLLLYRRKLPRQVAPNVGLLPPRPCFPSSSPNASKTLSGRSTFIPPTHLVARSTSVLWPSRLIPAPSPTLPSCQESPCGNATWSFRFSGTRCPAAVLFLSRPASPVCWSTTSTSLAPVRRRSPVITIVCSLRDSPLFRAKHCPSVTFAGFAPTPSGRSG